MKKVTIVTLLALWACVSLGDDFAEINTTLMRWTFRIEGPAKEPGKTTLGTVFVVGDLMTNEPPKARFVLVTAAHVLQDIASDKATLQLRVEESTGKFQRVPYEIQIRRSGKPIWTKHPDADVAAMYVRLPHYMEKFAPVLGANLLVDDARMVEYEIHPGDTLFCLGFPNGAFSNEAGFPILRSGPIASYPLVPAKEQGSFLYDFEVFNGNSGGPVYFCQTARAYGGKAHVGQTFHFIAGLVSKQKSTIERRVTPIEVSRTRRTFEVEENEERLKLAIVVPSEFISDTIAMLRKDNN